MVILKSFNVHSTNITLMVIINVLLNVEKISNFGAQMKHESFIFCLRNL